MSGNNFSSVVSVLNVQNHAEAVEWYSKWLGRSPDVSPDEGISEWMLAENAWIQVSLAQDPTLVGKSSVVCGVHDLEVQRATCEGAGVAVGETQDFGFIKLMDIVDPAGNSVVFVQEIKQ
jgi:hypothetical protein